MNKLSFSILGLAAAGLISTTAVADPARLPDGSVSVPKLAQRRIAIRTILAREGEHPVTAELNGRVGIDPNAGGRVQAPFAGRIEAGPNGLPVAGQRVEKGQVLLYVRPMATAIERGNQQAQLVEIQTSRRLAEQRVKRLESLEGSVPQKEIEAARAELTSLIGREKAVSGSIGGKQAITAPASGIVATANALGGQIVDAREVLFDIIDPNRMMVEALTTEPALAARIDSATLANIPGVALGFVGGGRSLRDGALPLNFRARAKDVALAVGQPVTVVAKLKDTLKGIVVPTAAVVRNPSNEPVVWIKSGAERFIAQAVETRPLDAGRVVVVKGLAADSRVVVAGAALINQIR
jgi:cobalt-zinc-cadmium efflux system membrane fusion protein